MSTHTARASVLHGPNGKFTVETYEVPALKSGQFLLRSELSGICGTDVHIYHGRLPSIQFPVILGHEVMGTIEQIGDKTLVDTLGQPVQVGDRVIPMPATPNDGGYEYVALPGPVVNYPVYDVTGFTRADALPLGGGMSELVVFNNPRTRFFKTNMPPELAVLAEPFATPVHAVQRVGLAPGTTVLVQGTGAVGLLAIAAAIAAGATRVIATGGPKSRLDIAGAFGADVTIDIGEVTDPAERVRLVRQETPGGHGVDVVFECAGAPGALIEGLECLRNGGRFAELGHFTDVGSVPINPWKHLLSNNVTLIGSSGYTSLHFLQGIRLLEKHAFPYEMLVTHKLPLERLGDAINAMTPAGGWVIDGKGAAKITIAPNMH